LCLAALPAFAQPFTIGVKAGVPLTDFVNTVQTGHLNYNSSTNRYIVGLDAELRLPFGFGVEFNALYRRLHYNGSAFLVDTVMNSNTTGNAWEFPLLAKYRFHFPVARPFVSAGVAWNTLQGLSETVTTTVLPNHQTSTTTTSSPAGLRNRTTTGFVIGGGVDIHALLVHVSPEIRYTRWGAKNFLDPNGGFSSNQNQAEFLVGITF
jgi:opacity protein-like surface antigen